jgi:hypothetical protein
MPTLYVHRHRQRLRQYTRSHELEQTPPPPPSPAPTPAPPLTMMETLTTGKGTGLLPSPSCLLALHYAMAWWRRLSEVLDARPFLVNTLFAGAMTFTGDVLAQAIEQHLTQEALSKQVSDLSGSGNAARAWVCVRACQSA